MTCPACGHDRHITPYKKIHQVDGDLRRCKCDPKTGGCGNEWYTREAIITVVILNPETLQEDHVPLAKFSDPLRQYVRGRARHPHQLRLIE